MRVALRLRMASIAATLLADSPLLYDLRLDRVANRRRWAVVGPMEESARTDTGRLAGGLWETTVLWESLANPWRCCLEEAWAAYRAGSIPIGAVVVDQEGRVVSRGRNRIFERTAEPPFLAGHRLAHAEVNALLNLDHDRIDPRRCTLYTTTEPCPLCTGAIRIMRVGEVHYAARDTVGGSLVLLEATPTMRRHGIRAVGPLGTDVEAIVVAMHVEFALRKDPARWGALVERWEAELGTGVHLGKALLASGELRHLARDGAPIEVVVGRLAVTLAETAGKEP